MRATLEPPPAATAESSTTATSNVPAALSSFVGRVREVGGVRELLGATRLLTVVGPGGAGKTRLAREVAATFATMSGIDAVWWVELASIAAGGTPDDILQVLGLALGVAPATGGGGIGDGIEAALADRDVLVVLDNCEHVVDAAAHVVDRLLRACPGLTVLATSREALGTEGETAWQLPPLAHPAARTPDGDAAPPTACDLAGYDAIALFVDRTRAASPGFVLTDANAPAVAAICAKLDGMPLAIELAAATLPTLGVEAVAARLGDALGLLTRGRRTALPRHRTLRAVLDWSYRLLDPAAQALLARLSVFRGAFPLDAAEAVGGDDLPGGVPVLDALGRLVEHSLVDVREAGRDARRDDAAADEGTAPGEPRYALLETVRQYGIERLHGAPDEEQTRWRHAAWIACLADAAHPSLWSPAHRRTVDRLRADLDDIRAALAWATAPGGDALLGVRIAGALGFMWVTGVPWEEGHRWTRCGADAGERAGLGDPGQPITVRLAFARSIIFCGGIANHLGDATTALRVADRLRQLLDPLERDLAALDAADDPRWAAEHAEWREQLGWARASEHDIRAQSLMQLGTHDPDVVIAQSHAACACSRTFRNRWYATLLEGRHASVLSGLGHYADARAVWNNTIAGFRTLDDPWMLSFALQGMSVNDFALGALGDAAAHAAESARVLRARPDPWFLSRALDTLAAVCVSPDAVSDARMEARARAAARLLGAAEVLRRRFGLIVLDVDRRHHAIAHAAAEGALGATAYAAERATGAALTTEAMLGLVEDGAALVATRPCATAESFESLPDPYPAPQSAPRAGEPQAAAPRALRVDVLGGFAVWRDGRALTDDEIPGGKVRELLLWFLLHLRGTKEEIGLALWPEASSAQLRSNFHFTLHHLRRALGDARWVTFTANAYALDRALAPSSDHPGGSLDADVHAVLDAADALRHAVRRHATDLVNALDADALDAVRAALDRYRGPVTTVTGLGAAAGDWITAHQDRVRTAWADGTALLGVVDSAAGRHTEAAAALERVLAVEPLREGVHRALMQAYIAAGEPARALAHYDALTTLLAREAGTAPARETRALAERLRQAA